MTHAKTLMEKVHFARQSLTLLKLARQHSKTSQLKFNRTQVKPVATLRLHKHHVVDRVAVKDAVEITNNEKALLTESQIACVPLGKIYYPVSSSAIPLQTIDVQSGSYFGEDDSSILKTYGHSKE